MANFEDYRSIFIPTLPFSQLKIVRYISQAKKKKLFKGESISMIANDIDDPYYYYVEEGQIAAMFEREIGEPTPLFWRNAGNAFSAEYSHLASIGRYRTRFTAMKNTVLFSFTQRQLYELAMQDPDIFYEFLFVCHMSFAQMGHRLSGTSGQSSTQRMVMWLQKLCAIHMPDEQGTYRIECNMTLKQISELLFIHITTCTKLFAALESAGIAQRSKSHIIVFDRERLPEIALNENEFSYQ